MDIGELSPEDMISPRDDLPQEVFNINDVFEAINQTDPLWTVAGAAGEPRVRIVEQPHPKQLRFRYVCEGRSAGSLPGASSTADHRTFPTIEVLGYRGKANIVVSCVTTEEPYRPHPHNLVGRSDGCKQGVCKMRVDLSESSLVSFTNIGIQCVKRKDVLKALEVREALEVDPFRTAREFQHIVEWSYQWSVPHPHGSTAAAKHLAGFSHKNQPQSIDLNAVRLCFQVFLLDQANKIVQVLPPVVSDKVYDKKAMSELMIMRTSHCSGHVRGGTDMILLCEKVTREDIEVLFYEEVGGVVSWSAAANIALVHRQVAIACSVPPYRDQLSTEHHQVFIQLRRKSDNERSPPISFEYIPYCPDSTYLQSKGVKRLAPFLRSPFNSENMFHPEHKQFKLEPREPPPPNPPGRFLEPTAEATPEWLRELDITMRDLRAPPAAAPRPRWPPPAPPHYNNDPHSLYARTKPLPKYYAKIDMSGGSITLQKSPRSLLSPAGSMNSPGSIASPDSFMSQPSGVGGVNKASEVGGVSGVGGIPHGSSYLPGLPNQHANMQVVPNDRLTADFNAQEFMLDQLEHLPTTTSQINDQYTLNQIGLHQLQLEDPLSTLLDPSAHALLDSDLSLPSLPNSTDFKTFDPTNL